MACYYDWDQEEVINCVVCNKEIRHSWKDSCSRVIIISDKLCQECKELGLIWAARQARHEEKLKLSGNEQ